MYRKIIVPLDGSDLAAKALVHARELARRLAVPIHLVRVVDAYVLNRIGATGLAFDYGAVTELVEEEDQDATAFIDQQVAALKGEGLDVTGAVVHGPVASAIVASAGPDDLIVMASHGRTGIQRWFLGSVAEEVLRQAPVPVLLVRQPHDQHAPPQTRQR
jgi:nucleotide-binding universal stress UspA family protein